MNIKSQDQWEQCYQAGDTPWNRGEASPPLKEWIAQRSLRGRVLVPGCGTGHDVAMLAGHGLDVTGLDIAPTALRLARAQHPQHAHRFVEGDLFALPEEWRGAFDIVVEHTCLSGLPPDLRPAYRAAVLSALKSGGLLVGVWFIDPALDPGETGPPFALPVGELDALFADVCEIIEDYVPVASFPGREGRERVRILRRL